MPDDPFDRLMRHTFSRDASDAVCPDSSVLAAFAEARLSPDERRAVESHAAGCSRCAAALARLATTADVAPGVVAVQERGFRPSWRWAVPLVTAVLVFAIWTEIESPEPQMPSRRADAPATRSLDRSDATPDDQASQKPAPPPPESYREVEPASPPAALAPRSHGAAMPAQPEADTAARDAASLGARKVTRPDTGARAESAPAPAAPPPAPGGRSEGYAPESQTVGEPSSEPSSAAEVRALAREEKVAAASANLSAAPFEVRGPGSVRIRATAAGIERSTDAGATWNHEHRGTPATIVAGVCASEDVCWLGADDGRVLRREAGGRWVDTRLATPERIVVIEAENAERATVKTASGRRFATEDGGRTWSPLP